MRYEFSTPTVACITGLRCRQTRMVDGDPCENFCMMLVSRLLSNWPKGCIGTVSSGVMGLGVKSRSWWGD